MRMSRLSNRHWQLHMLILNDLGIIPPNVSLRQSLMTLITPSNLIQLWLKPIGNAEVCMKGFPLIKGVKSKL